MKMNLCLLCILLATGPSVFGQHITPETVDIPHPTLVVKNLDSFLTVKVELGGGSFVIPPLEFSKPKEVIALYRSGGYTIYIQMEEEDKKGKTKKVWKEMERVPPPSEDAAIQNRSTWIGAVLFNKTDQRWEFVIKPYNPSVPAPK